FMNTRTIELRLYDHFNPTQIGWVYAGALAILFLAIAIAAWNRPMIHESPHERRLLKLSAILAGSWGVFCLLWEPTQYYWAAAIVPIVCLIGFWLRRAPGRHLALVFLLCGIAWNVRANRKDDRYYAQGAPTRWLLPLLDLPPND